MKQRFERLLAEYGRFALVVYFAIFALSLTGFATAIQLGVEVKSAAGTAGTWAAAYVATKVLQPIRIVATLVLTPIVVRIFRKVRKDPASG